MMDTKSLGANALVQISNKDFLTEVAKAAPAGSNMWSCFFSGVPHPNSAWSGQSWRIESDISAAYDSPSVHKLNSFYSVAAFKNNKGTLGREKGCFARLLALVVDDVNLTTVKDEVSYVIETSPRKFQAGVFLDAKDPDCANVDLVAALVDQMTKQGMMSELNTDDNMVRYVRMPCGTNHKERTSGPFTHRTSLWQPEVRLTLEDAAALFGIDFEVIGYEAERARINREDAIQTPNFTDSLGFIDTPEVISTPTPAPVPVPAPAPVNTLQPFVVDPVTNEVARKKIFTKIGNPLLNLGPTPMVVQKLFELDALSILFGPSGTYKSFVAVDLACSVATGTKFHGYKTKKMAVIYVAGEGQKGIKTRMAAWSIDRGIDLSDAEILCTNSSISLLDEDSIKAASEEIKEILERCQLPLGLIIIDTIARNFGDGDESSAKDVAKYLNHIDNYLRVPFGPNVLSLAHSGLEEGRVRGSTAWKAGMDQQYETSKKPLGMMELKCHKMKDSKMPEPMTFAMKSIYIRTDIDDFGDEYITDSLVLTVPPAVTVPTVCLIGSAALSPACLVDYMIDGWTSSKDTAAYFNCSLRDLGVCVAESVKLGLIEKFERKYILTQKGRSQNVRGPGGLGLPDTSQH